MSSACRRGEEKDKLSRQSLTFQGQDSWLPLVSGQSAVGNGSGSFSIGAEPSLPVCAVGLHNPSSESRSVVSHSLRPHGLCSPWNSPGQNTRMGSLSLLQGIFPFQGLNPGLLHCRQILYLQSHLQTNKQTKSPETSPMHSVQLISEGLLCPALPSQGSLLAAQRSCSAAAQLPAGLGPQENRKACWAGTAHRASGSSSGSLPYPSSRGLPVDLSLGLGLQRGPCRSCAAVQRPSFHLPVSKPRGLLSL